MRLTEELIKKKTEHHDGLLADLEEITLHQLEIERIEVIGTLCRKLQILYLQNNIIERIEGLAHCKDLRYLNLALNNVSKIEGLACVACVHAGMAGVRRWKQRADAIPPLPPTLPRPSLARSARASF